MTERFTRDLVQAVSDWQRGGSHKTKVKRGDRLKAAAAHLPPHFRACDVPCFRQEAHEKDRIFDQLIANKLDETIAAWTTSESVAKDFKGGVSPNAVAGVILVILPPEGSVVVNLERLYNDPDFQAALVKHGPAVDYFAEGAGKYGNSQCEVVLELGSLTAASIYSYGKFAGDLDTFKSFYLAEHGMLPTPEEEAKLQEFTNQPMWLSPEATRAVIARTMPKFKDRVIERLAEINAASAEEK